MAEVPDHLVPRDGLTNSHLRFAGLDVIPDGGAATLRFELGGAEQQQPPMATIAFGIAPQAEGTVDAMLAEGYAVLRDLLRQWLYEADRHQQAFAKRAAPPRPPQS